MNRTTYPSELLRSNSNSNYAPLCNRIMISRRRYIYVTARPHERYLTASTREIRHCITPPSIYMLAVCFDYCFFFLYDPRITWSYSLQRESIWSWNTSMISNFYITQNRTTYDAWTRIIRWSPTAYRKLQKRKKKWKQGCRFYSTIRWFILLLNVVHQGMKKLTSIEFFFSFFVTIRKKMPKLLVVVISQLKVGWLGWHWISQGLL